VSTSFWDLALLRRLGERFELRVPRAWVTAVVALSLGHGKTFNALVKFDESKTIDPKAVKGKISTIRTVPA